MKRFLLWAIWTSCLLLGGTTSVSALSNARKKRPKQAQREMTKKPGKYEKLFEKGVLQRAKGDFASLYLVGEKLYLELPLSSLGREILLSSTTARTSDSRFSTIGYRPEAPLLVRFMLQDTLLTLRRVNARLERPHPEDCQEEALARQNFEDPISEGFRILAYNPDSTTLVVDATRLLSDSSDPALEPVQSKVRNYEISFKPDSKLTAIVGMGAYSRSLTVRTRFSGLSTIKDDGVLMLEDYRMTVEAQRTLLFLPDTKMKPRISDQRIGTFLTAKQRIPDGNPVETYTLANRWRLEPSDTAAYARGERVRPVEPIVFHLDTLFPSTWREAIRRGVLRWNRAFERIGFMEALEVRDYPRNDPGFDPNDLSHSCIRYLPSEIENAMGPSWVDPSTGEIISASVLISNDVVRLATAWRFFQTAQLDPRVRTASPSEELLLETLSYIAAHEVGHCLGLLHNMAASAAIPTDSLRSANFTARYGITPSIMDYARFNYVAQPEDLGARLTPPELGVYDYYAIEWLYRWYPGGLSVRQEAEVGERLIDAKEGNPMYRYIPQQIQSRYDPSVIEEDLGNDALKSAIYGVANLKWISSRMEEWLAPGDPEFRLREELYPKLVDQYHRYLIHVLYQVGGIRLDNSRCATEQAARFVSVPAARQEAALRWALRELCECDWLLAKPYTPGYPIGYYQTYAQQSLLEPIQKRLASLCARVTVSSYVAQETPFTIDDCMRVLYEELWERIVGECDLTPASRFMQRQFLGLLNTRIREIGGNTLFLLAYAPDREDLRLFGLDSVSASDSETALGKGYGWQPKIDVTVLDRTDAAFLTTLIEVRDLLRTRMSRVSAQDRNHYEAMLYSVEQMLGTDNPK